VKRSIVIMATSVLGVCAPAFGSDGAETCETQCEASLSTNYAPNSFHSLHACCQTLCGYDLVSAAFDPLDGGFLLGEYCPDVPMN